MELVKFLIVIIKFLIVYCTQYIGMKHFGNMLVRLKECQKTCQKKRVLNLIKRELFFFTIGLSNKKKNQASLLLMNDFMDESGLKSSYDVIICAIDDFFDQWDTSTVTPMEE